MVTAIVLAAGRSTRMKLEPSANKQFLPLHGQPVLYHSLLAFQRCAAVDAVIVVRHPDYIRQAAAVVDRAGAGKVHGYAAGGTERQDSVWNGLDACPADTEIVAVHDGARPLVTPDLIERTIRSAREHGTGIAATKVVDTIKEARPDRTVERTVDRTKLWAVQTPQTVRFDLLRRAYTLVRERQLVVTDEAAAVALLGEPVHLVDTPFLNLKITTPTDLALAEALLRVRD